MEKTTVASWGHDLPPFCGGEVRNPSLQQEDQDPHQSLGEGNRLGESQSSCPAFAWVQECELLRQEVKSLRECVSQLCSECRHNFRELKDSLGMAKLQTGEDNRVDFTQNKLEQQQLEQHKQEKTGEQDDQLEKADLDSQQKLEENDVATKGELSQLTQKKKKRKRTRKQKQQEVAWEETSYNEHQQELWCNNSLGTTSSLGTNSSIGTTSSLGTIPEEELPESFDQEKCMILVDTGAELSAAPWAFASQVELSPAPPDLQLRNADGKAIQIFGLRTLQLFSQGVSFTMTFVIASVETPLLGLGSLLQENMCLHFDPLQGHQLVTTEGERMQLVQCGSQVYLPAFHRQLLSSSSMIGALYSFVPEDELGYLDCNLGQHKEVPKKGGVGEEEPSFTLDLGNQKKQENKPAIGQQQLALPKLRRTQNKRGQQQVDSKLRTWQQLRYKEKMQLALLEEPRVFEKEASLDLSLRIILLVSLMNKWQLATTRIQPACQEQLKIGHLRELGLIQSNLCFEIFHGDQLCVFLDESCILIGGKKDQQECFLHKLSAKIPLTDTVQLDQETSLSFQGKTLKYHQATRSISLTLPKAFYQQLLSRYNLQDATALDMPMQELVSEASRWTASILDASRTKLYKMTVGELVRLSQLRPDIGFALASLRQSLRQPTTHDEAKLCSLLRYLLGTQHHGVSLHLPKRWGRAKDIELLAFSATSWGKACGNISGSSLTLMGIPLAASTSLQATRATAEVGSVQLVCAQACHTRILLTELELVKPMFFRVLAGTQVSRKLGLSNKNKHTELWSRMGQFQVSKVASHKNLAEKLTYNLGTPSLEEMLTKLRVHHQPAEMQALPTRLSGEEGAFFLRGPPSFYIGMLTKHPAQLDLSELEQDAMEELCALQLCSEQLSGKESEEQFDLPKLYPAYALQLDLEKLERIDLDQLKEDQLTSLDLAKLERDELQTKNANQLWGKELENSATIPELQIQQKPASTLISFELDIDSSTRAWDLELEDDLGSTRASALQEQLIPVQPSGGDWVASSALGSTRTKKRTRASHSLRSTSLFSIFSVIFMIGSLTSTSLSFQMISHSLTSVQV